MCKLLTVHTVERKKDWHPLFWWVRVVKQKKTVSNEARRNPKLTPKIAWWGIQVRNEVMLLNILKSPESYINPWEVHILVTPADEKRHKVKRKVQIHLTHWEFFSMLESQRQVNWLKLVKHHKVLFEIMKSQKSEESDTEKFIHSEKHHPLLSHNI